MLNDFLYNIDANTMVLGLLFVIFFAFINFALYKTLKNRGTASIIAFCVSLLAVYGLNRTNLNFSGFFYGLGLSDKIMYSVVPILIILGIAFMIWKLKLRNTLMLLGIFLIILSFTPLVYEKTWVLVAGIILLVLGILLWIRHRRKNKAPGEKPEKEKPKGPSESEGKERLKDAAKKFNGWARGQSSPKFVGNWTNFINYLKKGGWGTSEAEICTRLGISQADFVNIFNSYGIVK